MTSLLQHSYVSISENEYFVPIANKEKNTYKFIPKQDRTIVIIDPNGNKAYKVVQSLKFDVIIKDTGSLIISHKMLHHRVVSGNCVIGECTNMFGLKYKGIDGMSLKLKRCGDSGFVVYRKRETVANVCQESLKHFEIILTTDQDIEPILVLLVVMLRKKL
jgi:hypothetical protein